MSVYEHSITISRRPEKVFSVIADAGQIPNYSTMIRRVEQQANNLLRIEGLVSGFNFIQNGFFKVDEETRKINFGSSDGNLIDGWVQVIQGPDAAAADVTVHLELSFSPEQELYRSRMTDFDSSIKEGLRSNLESLKNYCEGHGDPVDEADAAAPA